MGNIKYHRKAGFTLIEVLVAIALFTVVMTVATGALLSIIHANKKAQAIQTAVNNTNVAIDGMVRAVRTGTTYHCGQAGVLTDARDCTGAGGEAFIAFRPHGGARGSYRAYYFKEDTYHVGGIYRQDVNEHGQTLRNIRITAPEVNIKFFKVFVRGASASDDQQPIATFIVKGVVGDVSGNPLSLFGVKKRIETSFVVQGAATQRLLDL